MTLLRQTLKTLFPTTNLKLTRKNTRHSTIQWRKGHIFCHPEHALIITVSRQGLRSHYQQIDDSVQENKQRRCQISRISTEVQWEAAGKSGNGDISTSHRRAGHPLVFRLRQTSLNNIPPVDPISFSVVQHMSYKGCDHAL